MYWHANGIDSTEIELTQIEHCQGLTNIQIAMAGAAARSVSDRKWKAPTLQTRGKQEPLLSLSHKGFRERTNIISEEKMLYLREHTTQPRQLLPHPGGQITDEKVYIWVGQEAVQNLPSTPEKNLCLCLINPGRPIFSIRERRFSIRESVSPGPFHRT